MTTAVAEQAVQREVEFLTVPEFARVMNVSKSSAWKLVHSGAVRAHRIGHLVRIPRSALAELPVVKTDVNQ